jgi:hypothetical protein
MAGREGVVAAHPGSNLTLLRILGRFAKTNQHLSWWDFTDSISDLMSTTERSPGSGYQIVTALAIWDTWIIDLERNLGDEGRIQGEEISRRRDSEKRVGEVQISFHFIMNRVHGWSI